MRVIHFVRPEVLGHAEPLCGVWGSMDTDWTGVASGVTCAACRGALRGLGSGPLPATPAASSRRRPV